MRKILSIFILSVFLIGLTMPVLVGAQGEDIKECCIIGQVDIKIGDAANDCTAGQVSAPDQDKADICKAGVGLCGKEKWGMYCLLNVIYNVTNWLFYIVMIAVVILFVIAGAWFMLAGGDVEKTGKAKGLMILGVVGLAIALLAKLIPSVVKLLVGM